MPKWRTTTQAIVIWTVVMFGLTGLLLGSPDSSGGFAILAAGVLMLWFIVTVALSVIWVFSGPPEKKVAIIGRHGQKVMVSESEARKRVATTGWTYDEPPPSSPPAPEY